MVVEGLARARRQAVGEIRKAQGEGLDQLRASISGLFAGFELASPLAWFGSGGLRGQGWVGKGGDERRRFSLDDGYHLMPYFRPEAIDLARADGVGFLSLGRSALSDLLCSLLADW